MLLLSPLSDLNRQTDLLPNKDLGFSLVSDAEIRKSILQRTSIKNDQHTVSSTVLKQVFQGLLIKDYLKLRLQSL